VTLKVPSDNGTLSLVVTGVTPSVSSLSASRPRFLPGAAGDGVGRPRRLVLELTNPLSAAVVVASARLSGRDVRRFGLVSNGCGELAPAATACWS
jgi:hypothetical protein